jgi:hypothetical protein
MPEIKEEQKVQVVKSAGGGISFLSLLFLLFLGLKLTGVISWSWWYVTMPLWGGWALILGILLIAAVGGLIVFGIMALHALIKDAKRRKTIDKR